MGTQNKTVRRRGTAIVETAIVLGLLLLIILGGLEYGLVFYVRHTMSNAANEGARYLAVRNGTETQAEGVAQTQLNQLGGLSGKFKVKADDNGTDATVTISILRKDVSLGLTLPGMPLYTDADTIVTYTTMRKETQ